MDANKFVAEGKLEEEHKRRQAEWERVRKPSDPIEAPAEMFDNRTLYDRLKEQHEFKKKQFEDQFALKNQIRGIDTDEADFLNQVDRIKEIQEKKLKEEEKKELNEYKEALKNESKKAPISASSMPKKIVIGPPKEDKKLTTLISSAIIPKRKLNENEISNETNNKKRVESRAIIAILPGVGEYNSDSSDSSESSSDEEAVINDHKHETNKDSHSNRFLSHSSH